MRTAAAFRDSLDLLEQLGRGAPRRIYEVIFREQGRDENVRMDAEASGQAGAPAPANFGDRLAQRFAMPLGSMKSMVRRGLAKLRACLEPEAFGAASAG